MTYKVSSGTLNLCSLTHSRRFEPPVVGKSVHTGDDNCLETPSMKTLRHWLASVSRLTKYVMSYWRYKSREMLPRNSTYLSLPGRLTPAQSPLDTPQDKLPPLQSDINPHRTSKFRCCVSIRFLMQPHNPNTNPEIWRICPERGIGLFGGQMCQYTSCYVE